MLVSQPFIKLRSLKLVEGHIYGQLVISIVGCQGQLVTMATRRIFNISAIRWNRKLKFGGSDKQVTNKSLLLLFVGRDNQLPCHANNRNFIYLSYFWAKSSKFVQGYFFG